MKTYKKLTSCIFAMFICLCIVLPVFKANNYFRKKEDHSESGKNVLKEVVEKAKPEQQKEAKQKKTEGTQDRNIAIKNISIPKAIISEALKEESPRIDAQAVQKEETASVAEAEKPNEIIVHEPVKAVHAQTGKSRPEENPVPADLPHTASDQYASRDKVKQENKLIEQKIVEKPANTRVNPSESFDFKEYGKNLVEIAGLKEGESMPVLELDESNYKEGLSFYGCQLIARPQPLPKEPYYFAFNNKEIKFAKGKSPYIGTFYPAEQADKLLFERLLSQSAYNELAKDTQFQLFYVPIDAEKERLLRCKIKTVLTAYQGDVSEVVKIHGKFRKVGDAYILIVESFQKANGEIVNINDLYNNMVSLRGKSMETRIDRH